MVRKGNLRKQQLGLLEISNLNHGIWSSEMLSPNLKLWLTHSPTDRGNCQEMLLHLKIETCIWNIEFEIWNIEILNSKYKIKLDTSSLKLSYGILTTLNISDISNLNHIWNTKFAIWSLIIAERLADLFSANLITWEDFWQWPIQIQYKYNTNIIEIQEEESKTFGKGRPFL